VASTLGAYLPTPVRLAWPNDVVVAAPPSAPAVPGWGRWRKVAGILLQATGGANGPAAIVLGIGVNVTQTQGHLPVPWAGSLRTVGAGQLDRTALAVALLTDLARNYTMWAAGEPHLRALAEARCVSVGGDVVAHLPDGAELSGRGLALDDDGALVLRTPTGPHRITAGDIRTVRWTV
jgi:BirA family biotin operon repressor/biotin-[acetyl-CoA-carboxylase] ligase